MRRIPPSRPPPRFLRLRHRGDGTAAIEIVCLADEAELFFQAVRKVHDRMSEGLEPRPDRVDALVRIAQSCLVDAAAAERTEAADVSAETPEPVPAADAPASAPAKAERSHTGGGFAQLIVHLAPDVLEEGYVARLDTCERSERPGGTCERGARAGGAEPPR